MNQTNFVTKREYKGKNQDTLQTVKETVGYKTNYWVTFVQARGAGLKIKKGSKGVTIFNSIVKKDDDEKKFRGFSRVFNLDQTEKITN